jgi:hypothetical protein
LFPIQGSPANFWRFYPREQYQRPDVEAIAKSLRNRGVTVTVGRGGPTLEIIRREVKPVNVHDKHPHNLHNKHPDKKKQPQKVTKRRQNRGGRRLERIRRRDPDRIDYEKLRKLRALRERASKSTEPNNVDREQLLQMIELDWEILPVGTVEEVVRFFIRGMKGKRNRDERIIRERVEVFKSLQPQAYIRGVGGFSRYVGAKFSEDLVVFENMRYGNALYIVREKWEDIAKQSRIELLRDVDANFSRIIHTPGWRERLEEAIRRERTSQRARSQT